jgi:hypothetical protein
MASAASLCFSAAATVSPLVRLAARSSLMNFELRSLSCAFWSLAASICVAMSTALALAALAAIAAFCVALRESLCVYVHECKLGVR